MLTEKRILRKPETLEQLALIMSNFNLDFIKEDLTEKDQEMIDETIRFVEQG
jgi:hypothetical protein